MLDKDLGGGGTITVGVFYIMHYKYKNRGVQMDKKRMILASLASAAVLGAGFTTVQPLVVKADENAAKPATPKVIQDAQADADKADAKVKELEEKVADKTTEATAAATKLETEKKESTDAKTAKAEADKAKKDAETEKTAADAELTTAQEEAKKADAKAQEEAKKEEDAKKEEADSKEALKEAFAKLEKEIDADSNIKDKEAAKKLLGKEDLLAAVESGDLKAGDILKEFADDNEKAEANKEVEKKLRNKDQAKKADAEATAGKEGKTDALPEDLKAKIDEAEKADVARPKSEKLQDKADQLEDQLDSLEKQYDEAKKVSDEKAAVLEKQEKALKEAKEAADIAEKYELKDDIVSPLKNVVTKIQATHDQAKAEFDKANEVTVDYANQGKELEAEYNDTVAAVKAAKEEEAKNPKPAEKPVEKPKVKTEAEKAAEAKAEADKKVAEAQAKVTAAATKVTEATKALDEATTKATNEEADVQPAETAKTEADKAKSDAEAELAKAKEEAAKAKAKVEELKKEEADNLEALKGALDQLEKEAEAKIDANDKIKDKAKAKEEAKAAIGKDAILKAIENGDISATEAAKELEDDSNKAEAAKNQDPQADNIGATTPTIKDGAKVSEADKKAFAEADKKAAAEEAARPESEKIQDKADQLLKEINYLTAIADKDKAAAEVLLEKFNHAKEVLLEARQAKRAAEEANATPEVLNALKKVVYNLRLDRDTAKQELTKVVVPLEAYTEQINKLTDEYNQTLKDLEAAKAKEASTEKLDTPTTEETLAKEKAEADKAEKEYEKLLKAKEADKPKDVVTDKGEPAVQPENPEGVVTDNGEPAVQPENPEGTVPETPAAPAKPVEKSEVDKKIDALKEEIKALEKELAKDKDNEELSDKLNAMRSALARAEKDLKENPDALIYAVLLPKVNKTKLSEELTAQLKKLEEEEKTADETKKADLAEKIKNLKTLILDVKTQEEEGEKREEFLDNFDRALEETVKKLEKAETNGDAELEKQKQFTIKKLKEEAAAKKADFVKRFEEEGLTAKEAEKELDEANKKAEAAAKEKAAQEEFLANYDAALKAAIAELEKAETNSPEEAQAKVDTIAALKAASDETRKQIVKGFKKGLTAKQAEAFIDELNKKAAEEDKEETTKPAPKAETKPADEDGKIEALQNKVADLEKEVADNENNPDAVDYVTAAKEKLEDKKAELEKAEDELEEALKGLEPKDIKSEIKRLEAEVKQLEEQLKDAEENGAESYIVEGLRAKLEEAKKDLAELKEAWLSNVTPALPEYKLPEGGQPAPAPAPTPGTPAPAETPAATPAAPAAEAPATAAPAVAGTSQDNTYQAPAAKADDKKELPNTGGKDNVAIASLGFLGLLLGALPFAKRKN